MKWFKAAALVAAIAHASAAVAGDQDFTVVNGTGQTIQHIYVSASAADNWEEDVLGDNVLGAGQRFEISFQNGERGCLYDLKVTYESGKSATWNAIDLCKVSVVALRYDKATGKTFAQKE